MQRVTFIEQGQLARYNGNAYFNFSFTQRGNDVEVAGFLVDVTGGWSPPVETWPNASAFELSARAEAFAQQALHARDVLVVANLIPAG